MLTSTFFKNLGILQIKSFLELDQNQFCKICDQY